MLKLILPLLLAITFSEHAWSKRMQLLHMGRNFTLVVPDKVTSAARPLIVLLHGCKQSPSLILEGTQLEKDALKYNFLVLVPEQPSYYNMDHCWNWFLGHEQKRFPTSEMGQIVSALDVVDKTFSLAKDKIFVTGISAGGVMAHNLTACYPDVFAGSAIHSGLNFKVAENISEAQTVLTSYKQKSPDYLGKKTFECSRSVRNHRLNKVLIIHGQQDSRVPSLHAALISKSQAVWRDFIDDGKANDSVRGIVKTTNMKLKGNYEVEKTETTYPGFTERMLMVKGLGHAWGGGKPVSVNFDPDAPSSNKFILEFFSLSK